MSRPDLTIDDLAQFAREDAAVQAAMERRAKGAPTPDDDLLLEEVPDFLLPSSSPLETAQLVASIQERLGAERPSEFTPSTTPGRTASKPRRMTWLLSASAGVVALAAAVLLWVGAPPPEKLAHYTVQVEGSQRGERAASHEQPVVLRLRSGSELRFALRPETDVDGEIRARLFARRSDGSGTVELLIRQEQSAAGALRVESTVPSTLPESGELVLVVGRAETLRGLSASATLDVTERSGQAFRWRFEHSL
ncbi:MAG TPA: hypothetical protein VFQ61_01460 [Polyangiaceae bacterium]|nr:hypothetical protein [Polyangiaceae bacterium]